MRSAKFSIGGRKQAPESPSILCKKCAALDRLSVMPKEPIDAGRRALIAGAAVTAAAAVARAQTQTPTAQQAAETRLRDAPLGPTTTITVERRDDVVLIGLNRPFIQNRLDPPSRTRLSEVMYQYEHDPSLRVAVLFG